MRRLLLIGLAACGGSSQPADPDVDAPVVIGDGPPIDQPAATTFGTYSGMCGVLGAADLTSPSPSIVRDTLTFQRAYVDPDDRDLLTAGGKRLAETPNAGGSSGLSEIFAYEQLDHCEHAMLLKTETEIIYDGAGKITDLEIMLDGHKIGVSVTRAVTFPFGGTYTIDAANTLLTKKLGDIPLSTAHVSAQDKWDKQILAVLAWDDAVADTIATSWAGLDAQLKADTIVVVTSTAGDDEFIYSNN